MEGKDSPSLNECPFVAAVLRGVLFGNFVEVNSNVHVYGYLVDNKILVIATSIAESATRASANELCDSEEEPLVKPSVSDVETGLALAECYFAATKDHAGVALEHIRKLQLLLSETSFQNKDLDQG